MRPQLSSLFRESNPLWKILVLKPLKHKPIILKHRLKVNDMDMLEPSFRILWENEHLMFTSESNYCEATLMGKFGELVPKSCF